MSDPNVAAYAETVAQYIEAVCVPLLDEGHVLTIEHGPGSFDDYTFRVLVPSNQMPFMLGRGGENAEAVRRLARARARTIRWRARVDVRIVSI